MLCFVNERVQPLYLQDSLILANSVMSILDTDKKLFPSLRWQWRQRIRLYLEGTGINPVPVDLHEQQLSQEQHSRAHINERFQDQSRLKSVTRM